MKHLRKLIWLLIIGLWVMPFAGHAQDDEATCPVIVQDALAQVDTLCEDTTRNQACYGNRTLLAEPQPGVDTFDFDDPGDIVDVIDIQSLTLREMDEDVPEWGVALMRLQTNLPDTLPGQNVTMVLFGDVQLRAMPRPPEATVTVTAEVNINVRSEPNTTASTVGALVPRTTVTVDGRNEAGDWLRVNLPEGGRGWVADFLVQTDDDLSALEVVAVDDPVYNPMQAFYFQSGIGDSLCVEAPDSGILIDTPRGIGQINLLINEVNISLGSTVFLQARPGDALYVYFVSGIRASVSAFDEEQPVLRGTRVAIPIDANLQASGPPGLPEPYTESDVQALPIDLLDVYPLIAAPLIAPPLTEEQAADRIAARNPCLATAVGGTVNVRRGPGTDYGVAYQTEIGEDRRLTEQVTGNDGVVWYRIGSGDRWVRADLVELGENCADLPVMESDEIPPTPTTVPTVAPGEPACGVIFDYSGGHRPHSDWIYLLEGQQVSFTVSAAGQTWMGIDVLAIGPGGTIFNVTSRSNQGGESPVSQTFIASEDGWYYLEGGFGGGPDTTGTIYADVTCP